MQTQPGALTASSLYLRVNAFSKHSIRHAVLTSPAYGLVHHGATITSHHPSPPTRQRESRYMYRATNAALPYGLPAANQLG
ncbi:hypothetical protein E2C01_045766 [Portunus trituberculatus]|uniref:Uncharacterized protein n=1 Tax=Portunus trituberculatus TaxID=210409 RepID=A0A5B7G408_PORTR|nr:hypothetical protein [Portunus trituberculatus]